MRINVWMDLRGGVGGAEATGCSPESPPSIGKGQIRNVLPTEQKAWAGVPQDQATEGRKGAVMEVFGAISSNLPWDQRKFPTFYKDLWKLSYLNEKHQLRYRNNNQNYWDTGETRLDTETNDNNGLDENVGPESGRKWAVSGDISDVGKARLLC